MKPSSLKRACPLPEMNIIVSHFCVIGKSDHCVELVPTLTPLDQ